MAFKVYKYCKYSVFLNSSRYPDYTRPTLYSSIGNHIFVMATTGNMVYFSPLLAVKHVNLICDLKVYIAFNMT